MNSDPHDSTAWRSFGMLDSDETAGFDEAMRHDPELKAAAREMDRISAAVALVTSHPVAPRIGHLERIQARLGLDQPRRMPLWFGLAGWAAAAALALLLVWNANGIRGLSPSSGSTAGVPTTPGPRAPEAKVADDVTAPTDEGGENDPSLAQINPSPDTDATNLVIRRQTESFTREIAALQERLKSYQERENQWAQALPGVALPVIMKMTPPGAQSGIDTSLAQNDSPISLLLGETSRTNPTVKQPAGDVAGAAANVVDPALTTTPPDADPTPASPAAIPIYDAARDAGTLVVTNLPAAIEGREYNLWVQTDRNAPPVRLGILPNAGTAASESFDFSLGSNRVLPSGFFLTQDPKDQPVIPNEDNTVLQSPQATEP